MLKKITIKGKLWIKRAKETYEHFSSKSELLIK